MDVIVNARRGEAGRACVLRAAGCELRASSIPICAEYTSSCVDWVYLALSTAENLLIITCGFGCLCLCPLHLFSEPTRRERDKTRRSRSQQQFCPSPSQPSVCQDTSTSVQTCDQTASPRLASPTKSNQIKSHEIPSS